ncbi:ribonucleotide reductase N-terminal alpha domain-containing protein [Methylocaldum szegediense]|uniref:ribonucleotide reductase N-terminal alpha domain-containing protein n=1 Tax=Methylocaldum szegediense TaxID=73780 RepID=UPI0003FD0B3E|nr:LAGLIDADG family homing endonuclease [Methylocaldum szegediense]
MLVVKRDGSLEPLDVNKIHRAVEWACDGLDVSQSLIETNAHIRLFDGIKTSDIQWALIQSAAELVDVDTPDYTYAAARMLLQSLYKQVNNGEITYGPLKNYIKEGVECSNLDPKLLEYFDLDRLDAAIDPMRDFRFKYLGLQILADRYLIRAFPEKGAKEGRLLELPQHFWMRVAMGLALNENQDAATDWAIKFYDILSKHEFVSSTPTLFNSGTRHSQMSSCYVTTVHDSIRENNKSETGRGIFASITDCALLSKFAGGIGSDWTRVRAAGSHIKSTNGKSSGVVPYLKIFNDTAVAVNQCLAPNTLVFTADKIKPIKNVEIGDLVLGVGGRYAEVTDRMVYAQHDPMVEIDIKHAIEPIRITAGHPILAIRGAQIGQTIDRTLSMLNRGKLKVEWIDAGQLQRGDYVGQIIPQEITPVQNFTDDDARLYGIILGDGHYSNGEFEITCHSTLKCDTLEFVRNYLTQRGIHYWENVRENTTFLRWAEGKEKLRDATTERFVAGDECCLSFNKDDLYGENEEKRIARRFNHLPPSQTLQMIRGLIETNGNISCGKEITFSNSSRELIEGVRYQLLRLGIASAGNSRPLRGGKFKAKKQPYVLRIPAVSEIAQFFEVTHLTKRNWFVVDGVLYSRVKSIKQIDPVPFVVDLKVKGAESYMTTAFLAHNGGKRLGAFAAYLEPWHADILQFLDLKKPVGEERARAREIFTALWVNDLFMERVRDEKPWSLFDSHAHPELCELHGEAFRKAYEEAEALGDAVATIPANVLWRKSIEALVESGGPWITFKDEFNRRYQNQHVGVVRSSNLCVAPETMILTDKGQFPIAKLEGQTVKVWNGKEWSETTIFKTGENQSLLTVELSNGAYIECTPYHKFYVQENHKDAPIEKRANELKEGDKLIKFTLPVIEGEGEFNHAYTHGFFCGDGHYSCGKPYIWLYGEKKKLIKHLAIRSGSNKEHADGRLGYSLVHDLAPKFTVPMNYSVESRLKWLAGLLDADGSISHNGGNQSLQIESVDRLFLNKVRLMLQTLGVDAKVTLAQGASVTRFADDQPAYECQALYQLLINSTDTQHLLELGLSCNRLVIEKHTPNRCAKQFITVKSVNDFGRRDDTYCFTEPKRHMGMFNGILTGQCTEIGLHTNDEEIAVCNLGSLNLAVLNIGDFERVIPIAMRMLDNVIDLNFYPVDKAKNSNLKYRPVGLGVMGWMDYLVRNGIDFESISHLQITDAVFGEISLQAILASTELARERGRYSGFAGSLWDQGILPIDTAKALPREWLSGFEEDPRWDYVRKQVKLHGVRNGLMLAIAPTATIANIVGTTQSIEPVTNRVTMKKNLSGKFKVVDSTLSYGKPELCKEAFEVDQTWIIKAAAVRQRWLDQSQSVNLFKKLGTKGREISSWYFLAWELGLKSTYYLRNEIVEVNDALGKSRSEAETPKFCSIDNPSCEACQ